jgi:hypothetical protein
MLYNIYKNSYGFLDYFLFSIHILYTNINLNQDQSKHLENFQFLKSVLEKEADNYDLDKYMRVNKNFFFPLIQEKENFYWKDRRYNLIDLLNEISKKIEKDRLANKKKLFKSALDEKDFERMDQDYKYTQLKAIFEQKKKENNNLN